MAKSKYKPKPTWNIPAKDTTQNTPRKTAQPVRLSQCMIVKNEEKNIEKALSWAQNIACEQIVVDTGSTDRTVEIAERMGAKIYHFDWINDFSAAKNYAIDQAAGNWIAFLDADEYLDEEDAKKLLPLLQSIDDNPVYDDVAVLATPMAQLDDDGNPFQFNMQYRFFRNIPNYRYINPIHEILCSLDPNVVYRSAELESGITIFHTGYSTNAYQSTNKLQRNIDSLRKQLSEDPDDLNAIAYLADSLLASKAYDFDEVEALCKKVVAPLLPADENYKIRLLKSGQCRCFSYLLMLYLDKDRDFSEIQALYHTAVARYPDFPDFEFYMGEAYYKIESWKEAILSYQRAEQKGDVMRSSYYISRIHSFLYYIYYHMASCYEKLGDMPNAIRYGTLMLKLTPYNEEFLYNYIGLSLGSDPDGNVSAMFNVLRGLYDFTKLKDKLLLLKVAARLGNKPLYDLIYAEFTSEEKAWFESK